MRLPVLVSISLILFISANCRVQTDSRRGEPYVPYVTDQIVINDSKVLNDGAGLSYKLEPGNYKLEMTASNDGAGTEWIGAPCAKTDQMRQLVTSCTLTNQGQLVVTNPTQFGLGKQISVTIKVTKLAH